jgi:autophagy-related protein 9
MASYSAKNSPTRRRQPWVGTDSALTHTVLLGDERRGDVTERAQAYERALRQSQTAAALRRRQGAGSGSMAVSTMLGQDAPGDPGASMFQSSAGAAMAQTAVLGDSAASVVFAQPAPRAVAASVTRPEDVTPDDGVGSGLGESYVDGNRVVAEKGLGISQSQQEEEEGLEDGGVLGLLAQIYGTKGQAQGPARAI